MIHNISIATDDDVIRFGDDVNIYPVYLSRAIIICGNRLNWLEKIPGTLFSIISICNLFVGKNGALSLTSIGLTVTLPRPISGLTCASATSTIN